MPTKTGDKIRIIVLGTGPDAETARAIAESDADVALAKQFTKTVTHLVVDDTVKPAEARLKKAEEAGVPVLTVAEFRALLVAGAEDEVDQAVEAELEEAPAETPVAVVETDVVDETPDAGPAAVEETAAATEPVQEPDPIADPEPHDSEEPVSHEKPAPAEPVSASEPTPAEEPEPAKDDAPVAEAIDEPEAAAADPDKAVPSQADAPAIENEAKSGAKPGLFAKIKSIFNVSGSRK
ncbi:hypothetical protein LO763_01665 [Glycomyces sp. A-F 0318]|uniref:hypothetical protein n=1 Tax=Glycomyces amatae TaxID=2881355 RepID=UPI001E377418|nr:hypothetical protein [Glycomyces amatae]MCD0442333.1 hypothetical protein [Glycomyces amatae]